MAHAGTASPRQLSVIGAVLAAALVAGCGGSNEHTYAIGPTGACLRQAGERAVQRKEDPTTLRLNWAFLRFHPTVADAKSFDVSALNTNFGGYEFHRKRYGNVSLVWATGGARQLTGPGQDELQSVERCLRA